MKLPKIFMPEKNLEKNLEKLLSKKRLVHEEQYVFEHIRLDGGFKNWYRDHNLKKPFDEGLKSLRKEGYERHILTWEYSQIIISHYECKLSEKFDSVVKNIIHSFGEWFSMALRREGNRLYCFVNPENIGWNRYTKTYNTGDDFNSSYVEILDVTGIPSEEWVNLEHFNDDFVKFFTTRKFKDLPAEMQNGVYLPPEGMLWPVGRSDGGDFSICGYVHDRVSRGVKEKDENT